jgi:hypothetical protein
MNASSPLQATSSKRYSASDPNAIRPTSAGRSARVPIAYDGRENCRSYVIFRVGESRGLGTIRPCVYEPTRPDLTVPVLELYPDDVRVVLGAATPFVQSTHFAFSNDYRADGLRPKLLLFREVFRAAVDHRASHILTVIRDKLSYLGFYRKLGFDLIASGKLHPLFDVPTALLAAEIKAERFRSVIKNSRFSPIFQELVSGSLLEELREGSQTRSGPGGPPRSPQGHR